MEPDLDTFLTTVYVLVDDIYKEHYAHRKPSRPGAKPEVSDSELLTLAILAQHYPRNSERSFLRFVKMSWKGYFPRLLGQSSFNRRMRDLWQVLAGLVPWLAEEVRRLAGHMPVFELADGVGVALVRTCRARTRLFGEGASFGRGGSEGSWYYGVKLVCLVDQHGAVSGFAVCRADTEERWLMEGVLRWRTGPGLPQPSDEEMKALIGPSHSKGQTRAGPKSAIWPREGAGRNRGCVLVTDQGYAGEGWEEHWQEHYGVSLTTGKGLGPGASRQHRSTRQKVEQAFSTLFEHFGLAYPKARSLWGAMTRVCAKIAAYDVSVLINYRLNRPPRSIFNPIC